MASAAHVKSTGDTTFLLQQTQPDETKSRSASSMDNPPSPTAPTAAAAAASPARRRVEKVVEGPPCPDPSLHRNTKLQEQASSAALYVTSPHKKAAGADGVLDANNKLSSRSAAASLKYAQPRDLPSYPVVGIDMAGSANTAANLANTNHKAFEHWKPDASVSAGAAALAAKDYKPAPLWKPEASAAGSKAALLAHRDGGKLDLWMPQPSAEGNSAAGLAMKNKTLSPQLDYGYTEDGHRRALVAATGALGRSQSLKTPVAPALPAYPDSANSAHNALNAATVAHRPSTRSVQEPKVDSNQINSDAMRAARVQNYGQNVPREMFGGAPPVDEEKKKQAALRASAISMAKQLYDQSEKRRKDEEAAEISDRLGASAATFSHSRPAPPSAASPDLKQQAMQYIHLQEAAQRLASERLAKMDPDGVARYRAHYGYEPQSPRSRLSMKGRPNRRRAESNVTQDADDSSDDDLRSRRIRSQMNKFNESVAEVDSRKQQNDRAALLAAAEKKVRAQMLNMDDKVFQDTGKVSTAMMDDWEAKARARANADSEVRQKNFGKVNIGGGRYMDQSELDAIAQSRLQPTLDEIHDAAEKKRAKDEEARLDQEERRRQQMSEKEKERDVKAQSKRLKNEEKAQAKAARKMEKDAEKARKAEEKQKRKGEKRMSKDAKKDAADGAAVSAAAHETAGEHVPATAAATSADADRDVATDSAPAVVEPVTTVETVTTVEPVTTQPATEGAATIRGIQFENDGLTRIETGGTQHTTRSGLRPELDRHVSTVNTSSSSSFDSSSLSDSSDDSEPGADRPASASAVAFGSRTSASSTAKPGRFSAIFSRFKRTSRADEAGTTTATAPAPATVTATATATTATTTATTTTSAKPKESHESAPSNRNSASSFRRHQADLHSISSLSSDDVGARGRASGVSSGDEFEEARDTFDESLASPPTFSGQAKSESPARGTKFQEVL